MSHLNNYIYAVGKEDITRAVGKEDITRAGM